MQIRFLTCEPNLNGINNYVDEADQFYLNPATFLSKEYNNMNIDNLPSFVVIFDVLEAAINDFIKGNVTKLSLCAKYFHTHFNEGRIGNYINIYCRL